MRHTASSMLNSAQSLTVAVHIEV